MGLIERVKNIILTPKTEWPVIGGETATAGTLITAYVLPLAAIGAIAHFVSSSLIGYSLPLIGGTYRTPLLMGAGVAIFTLVMAVVGVFILSLIINALAPSFGGEKNTDQALKVAVYSYTAAWVAGIFQILPWVGGLLALLGALYSLYLLFLGLPMLMKCPQDKAIGYTAVVVICAIVLAVVIGMLSACIGGIGMMATGAMSGSGFGDHSSRGDKVTFDKDSAMGKLQDLGKKMEESGKKMEAAEKNGTDAEKAAAAAAMMGTLMGGGKSVESVSIEQLKPFIPDTFAGLPKKTSKAERTGMASIMISKAEATYGDETGQKSVSLDVSDSGGMSGLMGLASWANVQGEKEDQYSKEKTAKVDGRMVNEKMSKQEGGTNSYSVVLGERFMVNASGRGVDLATIKAAVASLDLKKLESMKDEGVKK